MLINTEHLVLLYHQHQLNLLLIVLYVHSKLLKLEFKTSKTGTYPTDFSTAFNKLKSEEGTQGLYKGLGPLWAR